MKTVEVNLDLAPEKRWDELREYREATRELINYYLDDFRKLSILYKVPLAVYSRRHIKEEYRLELKGMSKVMDIPYSDLLLINLYYDLLKLLLSPGQLIMGCSSFAIDQDIPVHARNMDWDSDGSMAEHTIKQRFMKDGDCLFESISWPGYNASVSGMATGRFSLTMNAVSSRKILALKTPVTYMIRDVLQTANSWEDAKSKLENTPLFSDCLFMLVGTKAGELCVIERTPKSFQTRYAEDQIIMVTNNYRTSLDEKQAVSCGILSDTSCSRYERMKELLKKSTPTERDDFMAILNDPSVKMDITVQQMVMCAAKGDCYSDVVR
ncbi:MAG: hypothetical protein HRT89_05435 [Lentisphaeria bacterium]|nr:acid ceramidase family protein [Lentisphaeria bacterium]NQZ67494.1 hypothetical protein [Lentisphaeria bacterium]